MFRAIRLTLLIGALVLVSVSAALAYTSRQKSDLHWINQVRANHHVKPALHLGKAMTKRAQYWANYLASKNSMEQDDLNGIKVCFKTGGYSYAANSAIGSGLSADQAALKLSPPHLANILGHYRWVGIGIASDKHGLIVVQDFCGK
jgi:uncharacterized protein YkwD